MLKIEGVGQSAAEPRLEEGSQTMYGTFTEHTEKE